jgi:LytTr DNA-binding domain
MESQFLRLSKSCAVNFANITHVQREQGNSFRVYLVGTREPITFFGNSDEAKALNEWWEQVAPKEPGEISTYPNIWK